jgi:serine/threonine-protein kinase
LAEFGRALQLQPNNAQALEYSGYVYRRQGQWPRCLETLKKSLEEDPRNADVAGNLAQTYCILRMWQDAERGGKYALSIDPADVIGMRALLLAILNGSGDIKRAQGVLATFPSANDLISSSASGIVASVTGDRAYTFVFARDFEAALKVWGTTADTAADQRRRLSAKATIRALAGDFIGAHADAEKARQLLEERLRERPGERVSMRELIWVYLALRRDANALNLARQAVELLPPERDALLGNSNLAGLAEVEARTGAASDAIAILRRLLTIPAGETVSIARLKIDPVWDPIRNDPGFQQLLTMQEHVGP